MDEEVVGITKFCVHPEQWFRHKTRIGGTKNINIETIRALTPSLIIANKEENVKEQVEELARDFNVLLTDVNNYPEALKMIAVVGNGVNKPEQASKLIDSIEAAFASLKTGPLKSAAYLIWKEPWMTIGRDTFIHDMMNKAGFSNVFKDRDRYPSISIEEIRERNAGYLLLSSEPYPFKQQHIEVLQSSLPNTTITLVDGEMFSWYGSRMLQAPSYFQKLFLAG